MSSDDDDIEWTKMDGRRVAIWRPQWNADEERVLKEKRQELERGLSAMRKLRDDLGLTQIEFAQLLGVTQSNVSKMERKAEPSIGALRKLVQRNGGRLSLVIDLNGRRIELPINSAA